MPFYWSPSSIPELASLPRQRRKQLLRECMQTVPPPWWFWVMLTTGCAAMLSIVVMIPRTPVLSFHPWLIVIAAMSVAVAGLFTIHWRISKALPEIRRRIGGLCPSCGYDLRATPQQCPECGALPSKPA